jgi:hypothetical protein
MPGVSGLSKYNKQADRKWQLIVGTQSHDLICTMTFCHIGAYGILPEASQEGMLRPYKSYADVTLFHYTVPPEVTRATWEFAAFMDNPKCPVKDVHM